MKLKSVTHMDTHKMEVENVGHVDTQVYTRISTPYGHVWYKPTMNGFIVEETLENVLEGLFNSRDMREDKLG